MLRTLLLATTVLFFSAGMPVLHAAGPAIENTEKTGYLSQLKKQHATADVRTALLAQINSLLSEHALLRGYQVDQPRSADLLYSVQAPQAGTLQIRQELRDAQGGIEVSNRQLSLYGMDPFFSYHCEHSSVQCSILHDSQPQALLKIVRRPQAASELARALSYLVRELQR